MNSRIFALVVSAVLTLSSFAFAKNITIKAGDKVKTFRRSELLKSANLKTITIQKDPSYPGRTMIYKAVPLADLFKDVKIDADSILLFKCLDGFSAPISQARVLNTDAAKAIAYVAIEDKVNPWPAVKKGNQSAGPFYLVWENPEKSKIGPEEWPYQLEGFEVQPSLEKQFPKIVPTEKANESVKDGYKVFTKNCFACHTMNGQGTSQLGPDLNIPYSPTEYLKPGFLKKLIRNPQDLRHWPQSKMSHFDEHALSDEDIDKLILYFEHMAGRR